MRNTDSEIIKRKNEVILTYSIILVPRHVETEVTQTTKSIEEATF